MSGRRATALKEPSARWQRFEGRHIPNGIGVLCMLLSIPTNKVHEVKKSALHICLQQEFPEGSEEHLAVN